MNATVSRFIAIALMSLPRLLPAQEAVSGSAIFNPTPDACCLCYHLEILNIGSNGSLVKNSDGTYTTRVRVVPNSASITATCDASYWVAVGARLLKNGIPYQSASLIKETKLARSQNENPTISEGKVLEFTFGAPEGRLADSIQFSSMCVANGTEQAVIDTMDKGKEVRACYPLTLALKGCDSGFGPNSDSKAVPSSCSSCNNSGAPSADNWASEPQTDGTINGGFYLSIPALPSMGGAITGSFSFFTEEFCNPGREALMPGFPSDYIVSRDASHRITQVDTQAGTLHIAPASAQILANDANAFTISHKDSSGTDFRVTTVSFVNEGGVSRLRMDSEFMGAITRHEQTRPESGKLIMEKGHVEDDEFEPLSREIHTVTSPASDRRVIRREIWERASISAPWTIASDSEDTWENQIAGWVKTREVIDPSGVALTSTWSYYQPGEATGPGGATEGLGKVKLHASYDGYESFYTYGLYSSSVTTPYAGNPRGKVSTLTWDPVAQTETNIITVNGQVLSKFITAHTPSSAIHSVYTSENEVLTTKTSYIESGDFGGELIKVIDPDGILTTKSYTRHPGGGYTNVVDKGLTTDGNTVAKGTRNTTTTNSRGTTILSKTEAIGYGTGSALFGSMAVTSVDNLGRALTTAHHPTSAYVTGEVASAIGAAWTTETIYSCCGVSKEVDMYGIPTFHAYDGIERQIKTNRLGVTTETVRKGLITETHRYAESVSASLGSELNGTAANLVSRSVTNLAGTLQESWSPDPTSTSDGALVKSSSTTTTYQPAAGLSTRTVTTTPDNFSQTTDSFLDARTAATYGALSPAMVYNYSVNSTGELSAQAYLDGTEHREVSGSQSDWTGRSIQSGHLSSLVSSVFESSVTSTYNSIGQVVKSTDPDGVTTLMAYNIQGEPVLTATDLNANNTIDYGVDTVSYFESEPATGTILASVGAEPVMKSTSKVWQPGDTNPAAGTVVSVSMRSSDGLRSSSQSIGVANPSTSETVLNGSGNWTSKSTAPDGTSQLQTYASGLLSSSASLLTSNSALHTASYAYDALNRPITTTDSRTGATTTAYQSATADLEASLTDPGNRTTSFAYDIRGRRISTTLPDSTVTTTTYTSRGEVASQSGSQTYPVTYTYDYAGRQKTLVTSGTQAATTTWTYSPTRGFLTRKAYHDGNGTDYTYTTAGRLSTRGWARAVGTAYAYDNGGRLTATTYSDNTPDVAVTYDALGRQTSQSNGVATTTYSYDPATLALDTETIAYNLDGQPGADFTRVLDRSRDSLQRDTGWELKDASNVENSITYTYGPTDGRLASVGRGDTPVPQSFNYSYTPNSNLLASVTGPHHTVTNTWEATRDVLASKENKVGTTVISSYTYTMNHLGQRSNVAQAGTAFQAVRSVAWGYDQYGQLITADSSNNADDRAYEFDAIGNRLKSADSLTLPSANNYTPNALNQYSTINALNPAYDADGNMTSGPLPANLSANSSLGWDAENRLIETTVGTGGPLVRCLYDSQSRRIAKTVGTDTTLYIYDGWNVIAEYQAGSLIKRHLWGMDLSGSMQSASGVGGLLATTDSSDTYYPIYDGNGNVSEYLDNTGSISAHYEYDPFGRTVVDTDSSGQFLYRFSTKPIDSETGLAYYGYRWYDPQTGRWPSRDPIEENGNINLYSFLKNNGISDIDTYGLQGLSADLPIVNCNEPEWIRNTSEYKSDNHTELYNDMINRPIKYPTNYWPKEYRPKLRMIHYHFASRGSSTGLDHGNHFWVAKCTNSCYTVEADIYRIVGGIGINHKLKGNYDQVAIRQNLAHELTHVMASNDRTQAIVDDAIIMLPRRFFNKKEDAENYKNKIQSIINREQDNQKILEHKHIPYYNPVTFAFQDKFRKFITPNAEDLTVPWNSPPAPKFVIY